MSNSPPELREAEILVRDLLAFLEATPPLVKQEIQLARRYRDDATYRAQFDAALWAFCEESHELRPRPFWPVKFESRPLHAASASSTCLSLLHALIPHCAKGSPHEILFVAIEGVLRDYHDHLESVYLVNDVIQGPRDTTSDAELDELLDRHMYFTDVLLRYCENALALVDSFNRVRIDYRTFSVQCRGKTTTLGNTQEFRLMCSLVESEGKYVMQDTLAEMLGNPELSNVKHIKLRLTKALRREGMDFVADAIRAEPGHYGLLFS